MTEISLFTAWHDWFSGHRLSENLLLWNHTLLFWARTGKVARFFGAMTIIIEIIGVERLRRLGDNLKFIPLKKILRLMSLASVSTIPEIQILFKLLVLKRKDLIKKNTREQERYIALTMLFGSQGWLWVSILSWFGVGSEWLKHWFALGSIESMFMLMIFVFIGAPLVFFCSLFSITILAILMEFLMFRPVIYILEQPKLNWLAKIFSLVCLLVGFHFELLAS